MSPSKRRLVAAYLSDRHEGDLLPWVAELVRERRLAETVKQGLRLVRHYATLPGGEELLRRGVLSEAVTAGVFPANRSQLYTAPSAGLGTDLTAATPPSFGPSTGAFPVSRPIRLDESLDRTLQGL